MGEPGLGFRMEHEPTRPRRRRRRGGLLLAAAALLVVVVAGGAYVAVRGADGLFGAADYAGTGTGSVVVAVHPGDTATAIGHTLVDAGVVKSVGAFTDAADADTRSRSIAPGSYRLHHRMSAAAALSLLLDPASRVQAAVTIPEGFRLEQVVDRIAAHTRIARADLDRLVAAPAGLSVPADCHGQLRGCLFPATYEVGPSDTATTVLQAMLDRFSTAAGDVGLDTGAAAAGRSPYDVLVVASLVEREARFPADRPKVAAVIYNRLAKGMKLQLDSTVNFALGDNKTFVTTKDTEVDSPYNTYLHTGLPPTPIAMPGADALQAALHPASGDWLYFITVDAAGHNEFTDSYQEFLRLKAQVAAGGK